MTDQLSRVSTQRSVVSLPGDGVAVQDLRKNESSIISPGPTAGQSTTTPIKDVLSRVPTVSIDPETHRVGWDGHNDPYNPRNWRFRRKVVTITCLAWVTFLVPLSSSMFAPALPSVILEFDIPNTTLAVSSVSLFLIGFAIGPTIWSPASELYGRRAVCNTTNVLFFAFTMGCAFSNSLTTLIVTRVFAGFSGSACLSVGGGIIADCIQPEHRGKVTALWSTPVLLGPVVGPLAGLIATCLCARLTQRRWIY